MSQSTNAANLSAYAAIAGAALTATRHRASTSDAELLDGLKRVSYLASVAQTEKSILVSLLRSRGVTWQAIGDVLGVTRSAAQQRFGS